MTTNHRSRRALTVVAGVACLAAVFTGTAAGAAYITGSDIKNQTITSGDIAAGGVGSSEVRNQSLHSYDIAPEAVGTSEVRNQSLHSIDMAPDSIGTSELTQAAEDHLDGVSGVESDGPYPGTTDLGSMDNQGDNSKAKVPADGKRHTVWVQCAPGKVALGGGFRLAADQTQQAAQDMDVLASEPTQIKDGDVTYQPIDGDAAGSFVPNGWLVDVVNNGDSDQTVRPWVTCAKAAK